MKRRCGGDDLPAQFAYREAWEAQRSEGLKKQSTGTVIETVPADGDNKDSV